MRWITAVLCIGPCVAPLVVPSVMLAQQDAPTVEVTGGGLETAPIAQQQMIRVIRVGSFLRAQTRMGVMAAVTGNDLQALGLKLSAGSPRDTLGVLVTEIIPNGPADVAGMEEGDRILSADGVNLKLTPADATDEEIYDLMARRLSRVLQKTPPGGIVDLVISQDGEIRPVILKLQTAKLFGVGTSAPEVTVPQPDIGPPLPPQVLPDSTGPQAIDVPPPPADSALRR